MRTDSCPLWTDCSSVWCSRSFYRISHFNRILSAQPLAKYWNSLKIVHLLCKQQNKGLDFLFYFFPVQVTAYLCTVIPKNTSIDVHIPKHNTQEKTQIYLWVSAYPAKQCLESLSTPKHYLMCCSFKIGGIKRISYLAQMHAESKMWDERLVEPEGVFRQPVRALPAFEMQKRHCSPFRIQHY